MGKRVKIATLLQREDVGSKIVVKGWVRTKRGSKNIAFIALYLWLKQQKNIDILKE